jgi:hypothetical protein
MLLWCRSSRSVRGIFVLPHRPSAAPIPSRVHFGNCLQLVILFFSESTVSLQCNLFVCKLSSGVLVHLVQITIYSTTALCAWLWVLPQMEVLHYLLCYCPVTSLYVHSISSVFPILDITGYFPASWKQYFNPLNWSCMVQPFDSIFIF